MQNINEKSSVLDWKMKFLEVAKIAAQLFKKTNDKIFYEQATYFKAEADKMGEEYNRLLLKKN